MPRPSSPACARCCSPTTPPMPTSWPSRGRADRGAGAGLRRLRRARDLARQERHAARRRPARRDADLRNHHGRFADTFERPIYAGNAIATVKSKDAKKVITVRHLAFAAAGDGGSAPVEAAAAAADAGLSSFVGEEVAKSDRPELTSAKIIVSGGRALQSRENFAKYHRAARRQARRRASAPRAPRSTPAMRPTTIRSARPARSSRRNSTSPSASPARSSISPA